MSCSRLAAELQGHLQRNSNFREWVHNLRERNFNFQEWAIEVQCPFSVAVMKESKWTESV